MMEEDAEPANPTTYPSEPTSNVNHCENHSSAAKEAEEEANETNKLLSGNGTEQRGCCVIPDKKPAEVVGNGEEVKGCADPEETDDEEAAAVVVVPPDGGWGWVIVAASFACIFVVDGIIFSFGVNLQDMCDSLHVSKAQVALVGSLLSGFYLLAGPFVSAVANKYGFRMVTMCGSVLAAGGFFLSTIVDSIPLICLFYGVIGGIGLGLVYSPSILIVGFYFEKWRALATGIAVCGSGIGTIVLSPLADKIVSTYGWKWSFRMNSALVLICIISALFFRPLAPVQVTLEPDENGDIPTNSKSKLRKKGGGYVTAAELLQLGKSTHSLTTSIIMTRVAALSGQTQSVPMIESRGRNRTTSETGSVGTRSRRGTVTDVIIRSRRGTITKLDDHCIINRPLYRDDIFYSGSLNRIPDYNSSQRDFMGYTLSVTRLPTPEDMEDDACCPGSVSRGLSLLFDTSLLKSPGFMIVCISGFLTLMGVFTPFTYLPSRQSSVGMPENQVAMLLSAVGMANTIGRVICGIISSCPGVDALLISTVALSFGGVATMISGLDNSGVYQFIYCAIFGFTIACFASLRSILVVDLFGIEKLTNAFGIMCLFQGLAAVCGSPLSGFIQENTGSYEQSFLLAGGFILVSGLICIPVKWIVQWEKNQKLNKTDDAFA